MREFINLIQTLSEAAVGMSAGQILKYDSRFNKFIEYIQNKKPFTTVDGTEVILDPREAKRFIDLRNQDMFTGILKARTTDGQEIPLSKLAKTTDFGGAAVAAGQEASTGGKEGLIVKPSQIGITDVDIPASDFYETILNNSALSSTDYGQVIQQLAEYIVAGEYVMLPEEYQGKEKEKVRKAIVDYAGEYLGVLALLYNRSRFPRKAQFEEWLGATIGDLTLNFPSKANTNLADSFAMITNPNTSHTLNISSKGTGGGAAPAISGLKVPDYVRNDPNFESAVAFIDICQKEGTVQQAFSAMDLIYSINPKAISKKFHKYLPFAEKNPKLPEMCKADIVASKSKTRVNYGLPQKYTPLWSDISGAGSEGGKIIYAIKKEVQDSVNNRDGIPGFEDAVLQILEMNFIQQYCDYKGGMLSFATQWPAKLDGKISVENKSSTTEPTAGGFSFKLGRVDDSVSSEPGDDLVNGEPTFAPEPEEQPKFQQAAQELVRENRIVKPKESTPRMKRK
jgi:hypothetical protein